MRGGDSTRISQSYLLASCALLFTLFVQSGCAPDDRPALRVGASVWPGYEPLFVAESFGFLDARLVKPIEFPSNVDVIRAYRNGVLDVAAVTADEALMIAYTDPGSHRVLLVVDYSNGADVIVAHGEFADMAELRGRRIGAEANAAGTMILVRALALSGLSMRDIQFVPIPLEDHESAFARGSVDALVTFEPRRSRLLAKGAKEVFSSAQIPGEVIDVLLARESLIGDRPEQLRHLVDAWFAAVTKIQDEPSESAPRAAAHQGVAPEEFLLALAGLQLLDRDDNRRLMESGELREQLDRLGQIMTAAKLLPAAPDGALLIDPRALQDRRR